MNRAPGTRSEGILWGLEKKRSLARNASSSDCVYWRSASPLPKKTRFARAMAPRRARPHRVHPHLCISYGPPGTLTAVARPDGKRAAPPAMIHCGFPLKRGRCSGIPVNFGYGRRLQEKQFVFPEVVQNPSASYKFQSKSSGPADSREAVMANETALS